MTIDPHLALSSEFGGGEPYYYGASAPTIGSATTVTQFINHGRSAVSSTNSTHPTTLQIAGQTFVNRGTIAIDGIARLFIDAHFSPAELGVVVACGAGGELWIGNHAVYDLAGGAHPICATKLRSVGEIRSGTIKAGGAGSQGTNIVSARSS